MKKKLAEPTAPDHEKGKHQKCSQCRKQMCFYNREGAYWVCFTKGICEQCYIKNLKK